MAPWTPSASCSSMTSPGPASRSSGTLVACPSTQSLSPHSLWSAPWIPPCPECSPPRPSRRCIFSTVPAPSFAPRAPPCPPTPDATPAILSVLPSSSLVTPLLLPSAVYPRSSSLTFDLPLTFSPTPSLSVAPMSSAPAAACSFPASSSSSLPIANRAAAASGAAEPSS
eukprot:2740162-Pyramimonas_sp.AAC.1